jgi:hypothetical protein
MMWTEIVSLFDLISGKESLGSTEDFSVRRWVDN